MKIQIFDTTTRQGRDGVNSIMSRLSAGAAPVEPRFYPIETVEEALKRLDREWAVALGVVK